MDAARESAEVEAWLDQGGVWPRPVVDDKHVVGQRPRLIAERTQEVDKRVSTDGWNHDVDRHAATRKVTADRRTRNGPIASTSTGAEPKHSSASRGSSTIGRPAVFRLVLTTTGTPVRRSTASSRRATSGSSLRLTVWMRAVPSTCTTAGIRSS